MWRIAVVGVLAGLSSGLFGVGGGLVMVPLLTFWLGMGQRQAIATSLLAAVPIAVAGTLGYAGGGAVDWTAGLLLALGGIAGGQFGVWLLPRVPVRGVQGIFALLLAYSAFRLVFGGDATASPGGSAIADDYMLFLPMLVLVGLAAGTMAGLLGIGGGVIMVPVLIIGLGLDIDIARGTSLFVVVLTASTASATNLIHKRSDVRVGAWAGLLGFPAAVAGAVLGLWLPAQQAGWLFAVLLLYAAVVMGGRAIRSGSGARDVG